MGCGAWASKQKQFDCRDEHGRLLSFTLQGSTMFVQHEIDKDMGMDPERAQSLKFCKNSGGVVSVSAAGTSASASMSGIQFNLFRQFAHRANMEVELEVSTKTSAPDVVQYLGQVVEPVDSPRKGSFECFQGEFYLKKTGKTVPFLSEVDREAPPQHKIKVMSRMPPVEFDLNDKYEISTTMPQGIASNIQWEFADSRERAISDASKNHIRGQAEFNLQNVGVGLQTNSRTELTEHVSSGGGTFVVKMTTCKACISVVNGVEPAELGSPYIRSLVAGVQLSAQIKITAGAASQCLDSALQVKGSVGVNPTAAAAGIPAGTMSASYGRDGVATSKTGPVASEVQVAGLCPFKAAKLQGKPFEQVLDFLSREVEIASEDHELWQVLYIEVDDNENVNIEEDEIILMIGNPGLGKSTLLNAYAKRRLFESGKRNPGLGKSTLLNAYAKRLLRIRHGLTDQLDIKHHRKRRLMDTPGLADQSMRERAASEITKA
eukprot:CAMPEP_0203877848 /NCGR_PEP_ID=MMETSP0359-20131031/22424_1 /ASSEMBLY_ACC=CAM_ASM_000338 /TAXON_ID=268821 /ORGANISM="Scrippsiella Hangoei, Strain SHTV-5" /LENGTH=489 /DNA_ID=CAMNT_0050796903 /DNA_START=46 /DNA_END=1512 /DNA_ORIENTATION=-